MAANFPEICCWHHDESFKGQTSILERQLQPRHMFGRKIANFAHFEPSSDHMEVVKCP